VFEVNNWKNQGLGTTISSFPRAETAAVAFLNCRAINYEVTTMCELRRRRDAKL